MTQHWNSSNLPPISDTLWLWIKTEQGEVLKIKRTAIIHDKTNWQWPVVDLRGNEFTASVVGWMYP